MPNLFIVAGPNGAGKSTYFRRFLAEEVHCREFVNADVIAAELSPRAPEKAAFEAGRIMLRRLRELAEQRRDFSFETTLSGRSYASLLRDLRTADYYIRLDFLWVPDLGITRERVKQRVSKGGHNIPDDVQQRRFQLGIRNLAELYRPLVNYWRLLENTGDNPCLLAEEKDGVLRVTDPIRLDFLQGANSVQFMTERPEKAVEEALAVSPWQETRMAMRALRRAYADVVLENLALGMPVIQWRQDRGMVEVPAEQLEPLARRILEVNGDPLPEAEERELLKHLKV